MKSSEKITCVFLQILQEEIEISGITLRNEGSNNLYSYHKGPYRKQKSTANQKQLDGWRRNILGKWRKILRGNLQKTNKKSPLGERKRGNYNKQNTTKVN